MMDISILYVYNKHGIMIRHVDSYIDKVQFS